MQTSVSDETREVVFLYKLVRFSPLSSQRLDLTAQRLRAD